MVKRPASNDFDDELGGAAAKADDERIQQILEGKKKAIKDFISRMAMNMCRPHGITKAELFKFHTEQMEQRSETNCKPPACKKQRSASPPKSNKRGNGDATPELAVEPQLTPGEIKRINNMKKKHLVDELHRLGETDVSMRTRKGPLVERLTAALIDKKVAYKATQLKNSPNYDNVQPMVLESCDETTAVAAQPTTGSSSSKMADDDDDAFDEANDADDEMEVEIEDDRKPAAKELPPQGMVKSAIAATEKRVASAVDGGRKDVEMTPPKKEKPVEKHAATPPVAQNKAAAANHNNKKEEELAESFKTASQGYSWRDGVPNLVRHANKHEQILSPIPDSAVKPSRSPVRPDIQPGTVSSTKKRFESSSSKAARPNGLLSDNVQQGVDTDDDDSDDDEEEPNGKSGIKTPAISASGVVMSAKKSVASVRSKISKSKAQELQMKIRNKTETEKVKTGVNQTNVAPLPKVPAASSLLRPMQAASAAKGGSSNAKRVAEMRALAFKKSPVTKAMSSPKVESDDNYEMSDHEADSDDSAASKRRANKKIPEWAKTQNLIPALEIQFAKQNSIDPDELFGEVETCDLAAMFPEREAERFRRRGSSGNWKKDGVTSSEKRRYKKQMKLKS